MQRNAWKYKEQVMPPSPAKVKNITFGGGGGRGWIYLPAIELLEKNWVDPKATIDPHELSKRTNNFSMQNIEKVAGSSCGAICALVMALNFPPEKRRELMHKSPGNKLFDWHFPLRIKFTSSFPYIEANFVFHLCDGKVLTDWLKFLIKEKTGKSDLTFAELHDWGLHNLDKDGTPGIKDLYIKATALNLIKNGGTFSCKTTPHVKVAEAVMASCSIPLLFPFMKILGHWVCDALFGLYNNPVTIFDEDDQFGNKIFNHETLGFILVNEMSVKKMFGKIIRLNIRGMFSALIDWMINGNTYNISEIAKRRLICIVPPEYIGITEFGWTKKYWEDARKAAYISIAHFFNKRKSFYPKELANFNTAILKSEELQQEKNIANDNNYIKIFFSVLCRSILICLRKIEKYIPSDIIRIYTKCYKPLMYIGFIIINIGCFLLSKKLYKMEDFTVFKASENIPTNKSIDDKLKSKSVGDPLDNISTDVALRKNVNVKGEFFSFGAKQLTLESREWFNSCRSVLRGVQKIVTPCINALRKYS